MARQGLGGNCAGFFRRFGFARARAKVAQRGDPPLAYDLFGNLMHRGQHATDAARHGVVWHRTIGNREMSFLDEAMTIDLQREIIHPRGRSALERRIDQRLQNVPDFRPALADRLAQRLRVLRAKHRTIWVIVDRNVLRSPPQKERKPVRQENADHHPQAKRPSHHRADWGFRPILCTDERGHFAAAGEEVRRPVFRGDRLDPPQLSLDFLK